MKSLQERKKELRPVLRVKEETWQMFSNWQLCLWTCVPTLNIGPPHQQYPHKRSKPNPRIIFTLNSCAFKREVGYRGVIPALGWLRQEVFNFHANLGGILSSRLVGPYGKLQARLGYVARPCGKNPNQAKPQIKANQIKQRITKHKQQR